MPITINGSGTVTGISAGGLPDDCIVTADIAAGAVTPAKLSGAQTGSAPVYGCRAWVNFDGTRNEADTGASTNGANVKIRAAGNVSSVLKNGTGDYTITFTTAMPDANYSVISMAQYSTTGSMAGANGMGMMEIARLSTAMQASSVRLWASYGSDTTLYDKTIVAVSIFR